MNNNTCIICFEEGSNIPQRMFSCNCKYAIHNACLERWNNTHESQCAICRNRCEVLEIRIPSPPPVPPVEESWWKKAKGFCILVGSAMVMVACALLFAAF
jgi:hypothetical protein